MREHYFDFSEHLYLVTGASSGIGKAISIALSECGARVVLIGRNQTGLEETKTMLHGNDHLIIQKDLADESDYSSLFDTAIEHGGRINGVVHCAGEAPVLPLAMLTREKMEHCMSVNFYALIELSRCLARRKYRADKACILEISSINSLYPDKCQTIYAASKAAANAAVQALALELVKNHIRINAILPGSVDTPMSRQAFIQMGNENREKKISKQILGVTSLEEIVNIALFMMSDLSSAITGRTIFSDGGYINF